MISLSIFILDSLIQDNEDEGSSTVEPESEGGK